MNESGWTLTRSWQPAFPVPARSSFRVVSYIPIEESFSMTIIRQEDFIASVAAALQYISYYHPKDFIDSLAKAYEIE